MGVDTLSPTKVVDHVVDALEARVTVCLHRVAASPAQARDAAAGAHVYGIGRVPEGPDVLREPGVRPRVVLLRGDLIDRRRHYREAQAIRRQLFAWGLEGDCRQAVCLGHEGADGAAHAVSDDPDVRLGIERRNVVVDIERGVVVTFRTPELLLETSHVASVRVFEAVADRSPEVADPPAAAREQQVVRLLVLSRSFAREARALVGYHDRCVVRAGKDVAPEAVVVPAEGCRRVVPVVDVYPLSRVWSGSVRIRGHGGEREDHIAIRDIRQRDVLLRPQACRPTIAGTIGGPHMRSAIGVQ